MQAYDSSVFPRSAAPALPIMSSESFGSRKKPPVVGALVLRSTVETYSGRHAIALAMAHAGLRSGDRVLVPAYHCLGMIEPLRKSGLVPVYYPIRSDLTVDPDAVVPLAHKGAKALLVVHYFGFVADLTPLRRMADRLGLVLVEDCAHACIGGSAERPVGSTGDYAIASTQKFFPIPHGGLLASAHRDLSDIRLKAPPLRIELKAAVNLLERSIEYDRLGALGRLLGRALRIKDRLLRRVRRDRDADGEQTGSPFIEAPEYAVDPRWLAWRATRVSSFLMHRAKTDRLVELRRVRYLRYRSVLAGRLDCRPLFESLPEGVVPQVFPLYVNSCLGVFVALKRQGVPIVRFGEFLDAPVTPELCPVSVDYAEHVLQFPCHQELRESELDWILERLLAALNETGRDYSSRTPLADSLPPPSTAAVIPPDTKRAAAPIAAWGSRR